MIGIYLIENDQNHKRYVGQSRNIENRWKRHRRGFDSGKHENRYMQRAVNLGQTFTFSVLEECKADQLDKLERKWIKHFHSNNYRYGYNLDDGGNYGKTLAARNLTRRTGRDNPNYGRRTSEETKEKQRKASIGKNNKLSVSDVEQIKIDFLGGVKIKQLAEQYGVKVSTIGKITTCKNWDWVLPELNDRISSKISEDKKLLEENVKSAYQSGMTLDEIEEKFDITYTVAHRILGRVVYLGDDVKAGIEEDFKAGMKKRDIMAKYGISPTTYVRYTSVLYNERELELKMRAREMRAAGMKVQDIAKELGKHRTTITEWTHG